MKIIVGNIKDSWKFKEDELIIYVRPFYIKCGERYLISYIKHELIESSIAKVICNGKGKDICGKLCPEHDDYTRGKNVFDARAGQNYICHFLTWLCGFW